MTTSSPAVNRPVDSHRRSVDSHRCHAHHPHLTRRRLLCASGAVAVAALAGCLSGDEEEEEVPEPVDLAGRECDVCGMVIGEHHGPNAQLFFSGGTPPADRDGPVWFDSTNEAVVYLEEEERRGHEMLAMYVVDYSIVDYELEANGDTVLISTHTDADVFVDARETTFVVGSNVHGAMGPDSIPFSDPDDATAFADEYGGDLLPFDELVDW